MLKFQSHYFVVALILFLIEVCIALFINDNIIRPYVGDFLVVILLYCFFKSFLNLSVWAVSMAVLLFAYSVEILQYFKIVERLGFQNSGIARTIIGISFEWTDLLAYTLGIGLVLFIEKKIIKKVLFKSKSGVATNY